MTDPVAARRLPPGFSTLALVLTLALTLVALGGFCLSEAQAKNAAREENARYFMKIEGADKDFLPGNVTHKDYRGWTELETVNLRFATQGKGGQSAPRIEVDDVEIVKLNDVNSPIFTKFCMEGRKIPKVRIHAVSRGGHPLLRHFELLLSNVWVNSTARGAKHTGSAMTEVILLQVGQIRWTAYRHDSSGRLLGHTFWGYNLRGRWPLPSGSKQGKGGAKAAPMKTKTYRLKDFQRLPTNR